MSGLLNKGLLSKKTVSGNPTYDYFYKAGDEAVVLTSGWSLKYVPDDQYTATVYTLTKEASSMKIIHTRYGVVGAITGKAVDLSGVETLRVEYISTVAVGAVLKLYITPTNTFTDMSNIGYTAVSEKVLATGSGTIDLDVSSINSGYIYVASYGGGAGSDSTINIIKVSGVQA